MLVLPVTRFVLLFSLWHTPIYFFSFVWLSQNALNLNGPAKKQFFCAVCCLKMCWLCSFLEKRMTNSGGKTNTSSHLARSWTAWEGIRVKQVQGVNKEILFPVSKFGKQSHFTKENNVKRALSEMVEFWYFFQLWKVCVRAHAGLTVCVHRTRRRSESCPLRSGTTPPVSSHRSWHRSGRGEKQQKVTKASADLTRKQELWGTRVIFLLPALPLGLCCPKHWAAWDGDDMSVEDWRAVPCPSPPVPPANPVSRPTVHPSSSALPFQASNLCHFHFLCHLHSVHVLYC